MSDTPAPEAKPATRPEAKVPARPVGEIRADIVRQRAGLEQSFEKLRSDLDEAMDTGAERARDAGQKAKRFGPIVAGVALSLVGLSLFARRRSRR
jgi:hypothetical protein